VIARRLCVVIAIALIASIAYAHPVRIGRYAEIPYGIRPDHPYPTSGGSSHRDGRVRGRAPAHEPQRVFERVLSHRRPRGPTIAADGTLYLGTMGGVSALGPDGVERWSVRLGTVHAAPSLAPSDDLVVVTRTGLVAIVSPEGVVRASIDLGSPARGSALVLDDGSILVSTTDQRVHRLDSSLRRVGVTELSNGTATPLSLTRRGLIAVAASHLLTLLDTDGRTLRQISLSGHASSAPAMADDGTIWMTTVEGIVHAIDPTGRVRSRTDVRSRHDDGAAPVVGRDGALRLPTRSEGIVCVGPGGTDRWRLPNEAGYSAPASIDEEDTTLAIDRLGRLIAVAADGAERWRVTIGTYAYQPPVLGPDGTIYVTTDRGAIQGWR
jgi:outer membrane protein assembly factor BamB